jgi:uncharacterized phiE125 gp8 family phage protein
MVRLYISVEPESEPITLADAKAHLRVDAPDDDAYITALITAARQWVEQMANLCLIEQTVVERFDSFPVYGYFTLAKAPVLDVASIEYTDTNGDVQTWAATEYDVDTVSKPARIMPKFGKTYPFTRVSLAPVSITYTAGFGDEAADVPAPIIHAMKLLVGEMYENRQSLTNEQVAPKRGALEKLLDNYRVQTL